MGRRSRKGREAGSAGQEREETVNLLTHLAKHGLQLTRAGLDIDVAPADQLTPELESLIVEHKPALLMALSKCELDRLIEAVADSHGFTEEERDEAHAIAAGDVENALTCFRTLAQKAGLAVDE